MMQCGPETCQSHPTEAIGPDDDCLLVIRNIPCDKYEKRNAIFCAGDVVRRIGQIIAAEKNLARQLE